MILESLMCSMFVFYTVFSFEETHVLDLCKRLMYNNPVKVESKNIFKCRVLLFSVFTPALGRHVALFKVISKSNLMNTCQGPTG